MIMARRHGLTITTAILLWCLSSCQSLCIPYGNALIDYSAANEYVEAHYGVPNYFPHDAMEEPIYNARNDLSCAAGLDASGFQVSTLKLPDNCDLESLDNVIQFYLPKLKARIIDLFPDEIEHIVFWHPMWRGEQESQKNSPVYSLVHVDTDVGAYELKDLMNLIRKNRIDGSECFDEIEEAITAGQRFAVVNAWRNMNTNPVTRAPLGIYAPAYDSSNNLLPFFPHSKPDPLKSRWYVFPELSRNEVLLFKQYDRRSDRLSDLWHCALPLLSPSGQPRRSLDLRAFCLFSSKTPTKLDRYSDKKQALLSLHQSECFCSDQAVRRSL